MMNPQLGNMGMLPGILQTRRPPAIRAPANDEELEEVSWGRNTTTRMVISRMSSHDTGIVETVVVAARIAMVIAAPAVSEL